MWKKLPKKLMLFLWADSENGVEHVVSKDCFTVFSTMAVATSHKSSKF